MRILMISSDRKVFEKDSGVRRRMVEYGGLADELHLIVFSRRTMSRESEIRDEKIADNVFVYHTNSFSRWLYVFDATRIGKKLIAISSKLTAKGWLVTTQDPFEAGIAGWRIARAFGAKLQIQIHTDFLSPYFSKESILNKIRVLIAKFILPKADCIRVVSRRISDSLTANSYELKAVPAVLPIFVDMEKIQNTSPAFDLHKKYPQFDRIILMASRLSKEKNIGLAISAMSEIIKKYPRNGLIIVGSGPERNALKLKAISHKLTANIVFEGWQDDLTSYYKNADLFLNVSNYEGYGLALLEAAISGCPIVTTDVGIAPELQKSGATISICPVGDVICIADGIINNLSVNKSEKSPWNLPASLTEPNKSEYLKNYSESWQKCLNLLK